MDTAHDFASDLACDLADENVVKTIDKKDFSQAGQLLHSKLSDGTERERKIIALLFDLLDMAAAGDVFSYRRAARDFAMRVIEYAYSGYDLLAQDEIPWWRRLFSRGAGGWEAKKQTALDLYWSLKIIAAREAGELPAWEGIRIVRERKTDAE